MKAIHNELRDISIHIAEGCEHGNSSLRVSDVVSLLLSLFEDVVQVRHDVQPLVLEAEVPEFSASGIQVLMLETVNVSSGVGQVNIMSKKINIFFKFEKI